MRNEVFTIHVLFYRNIKIFFTFLGAPYDEQNVAFIQRTIMIAISVICQTDLAVSISHFSTIGVSKKKFFTMSVMMFDEDFTFVQWNSYIHGQNSLWNPHNVSISHLVACICPVSSDEHLLSSKVDRWMVHVHLAMPPCLR